MKNSNVTIGNRTRDLPVCSAVPQPIAPPRTPFTSVRTSNITQVTFWGFRCGKAEASFLGTEPLTRRLLPGASGAPRWSHTQVPNVHTVPKHRIPIIHTPFFQKSPPPTKILHTSLSPPSTAQAPPPNTHFNLLTKWFNPYRTNVENTVSS